MRYGWNGGFLFGGKLIAIKNLNLVFYNALTCLVGDSVAYQRTNVFGDDVVIGTAYWTILCKSKRGCFKNTSDDDLLASVLRALIEKTKLNLSEVRDIVMRTFWHWDLNELVNVGWMHYMLTFPKLCPLEL